MRDLVFGGNRGKLGSYMILPGESQKRLKSEKAGKSGNEKWSSGLGGKRLFTDPNLSQKKTESRVETTLQRRKETSAII